MLWASFYWLKNGISYTIKISISKLELLRSFEKLIPTQLEESANHCPKYDRETSGNKQSCFLSNVSY